MRRKNLFGLFGNMFADPVDEKIEEIKMQIKSIQDRFSNLGKDETVNFDAYMCERQALSLMLLVTTAGATIKESRKDPTKLIVKFCHKMPDYNQTNRITSMLSEFVDWEDDFLESITDDIDGVDVRQFTRAFIPLMSDMNVKKLATSFTNEVDGSMAFMKYFVTPRDLSTVAAMAQEARHKRNFKIGVTVTIGVGVAIVGGVLIWKYLLSDDNKDENTDDSNIDVNDIDVDAIDVDDLDDIDVNDIDVDNLGDLADVDVE